MGHSDLVTVLDLENFKCDLLKEIKSIISKSEDKPLTKWLKSAEVRKILEISPGKLFTMRRNGLLAFTRIGGNIYYNPRDIQKMFEDNKKQNNRR